MINLQYFFFFRSFKAKSGVSSPDHDDFALSSEYSGQGSFRASNMHYLCPYVL